MPLSNLFLFFVLLLDNKPMLGSVQGTKLEITEKNTVSGISRIDGQKC